MQWKGEIGLLERYISIPTTENSNPLAMNRTLSLDDVKHPGVAFVHTCLELITTRCVHGGYILGSTEKLQRDLVCEMRTLLDVAFAGRRLELHLLDASVRFNRCVP